MGIEPLEQDWAPAGSWDHAIREANAWRGRCLNHLARAEAKVTAALIALEKSGALKAKAKLPHLVGQRFAVLAKLMGPDGPYASEGAGCFSALSEVSACLRLRNFLCHGAGRVYLDQSGKWLLVLSLLELRSGKAETDRYSITGDEAEKLAIALQRASQSLDSRLGGFLRVVAKGAST